MDADERLKEIGGSTGGFLALARVHLVRTQFRRSAWDDSQIPIPPTPADAADLE
jgi:hypothetical protein